MRRQKRASCTNNDYKKIANLNDKGKFRRHGEYAKNSSKSGILTVDDFYKNDKFGENSDFGEV